MMFALGASCSGPTSPRLLDSHAGFRVQVSLAGCCRGQWSEHDSNLKPPQADVPSSQALSPWPAGGPLPVIALGPGPTRMIGLSRLPAGGPVTGMPNGG